MNKTPPRFAPIAMFALTAVLLTGCSFGETEQRAGTPGFGDRCTDFMERAFPWSRTTIKSTHQEIARTPNSLNVIIATVSGERQYAPDNSGPIAHDVAVQCRFENGVLTSFKWTKGPFR